MIAGGPRDAVVFDSRRAGDAEVLRRQARDISQTKEALILRRCAYWISLRGSEPTTSQSTVRIVIPRANVFSVQSLQALMDLVREGELP
jgi:hypothetical protein